MKKIIAIIFVGLSLVSCASTQPYKASDITEEGLKYQYGSKQGIILGDKIYAYNRAARSKGIGILSSPLGTLTITRVESDHSIMKKDSEFELNEQVIFKK